jgi:hypothetical protein
VHMPAAIPQIYRAAQEAQALVSPAVNSWFIAPETQS